MGQDATAEGGIRRLDLQYRVGNGNMISKTSKFCDFSELERTMEKPHIVRQKYLEAAISQRNKD
ncbi:MAG: hypothetical protein K6G78_04495, partial [bacterium]|nr:hypothetical protein [bacterium]